MENDPIDWLEQYGDRLYRFARARVRDSFAAEDLIQETLLGTFILVFFGCGSVAVTVLFNAHTGLLQVAVVWGLGVMLAIYATRHLSCAAI